MSPVSFVKFITGVAVLCISLPIWFFLMYSVLSAVHVDRLVWFLFWVYVPVTFVASLIKAFVDAIDEKL